MRRSLFTIPIVFFILLNACVNTPTGIPPVQGTAADADGRGMDAYHHLDS
jgi:hypothetical protein